VLDGVADDTSALIAATAATAGTGDSVVIPYGTLLVTPGTAQTGAANYNCACEMLSNTSYVGFNAATIKVANGYSTDASPKELAIFSTDSAIAHVSFTGLTFDLNGANNLMSPDRPVTYNAYNHAAIMANGPDGYINNCSIYDCTFKDNAGVCFVVCQLVASGTTPIVGKTWNIVNNLFLNGGTDSRDHTSVYAFCENVICDGNTFWQDDPPHTVGLTGGATCYEVHGSNQRVVNNYFYNYTVGMYVAPNFTTETISTVVANNNFYCSDYGVLIWRYFESGVVEYEALDDILIDGNTFYFSDYTYSGQPSYKAAIAFQGQIPSDQGSVNNVKITNNLATNTGNTLLSHFVKWDTPTPQANQKCTNVSITDNTVIGFCNGVQIITNSDNAQGLTTISRNEFINLTPDSLANLPTGIYVDSTGDGCDFLVIDGNSFIDTRGGSASFARGILFVNGTITNLYLGPQLYSGLTSANYTESSVTITNWLGPARQGATALTYSASMTPDWSAGRDQIVTVTNSSNFTFNAPTRMPDGEHMTITIRNTSGGALGTATFAAAYGLAAWTQPANGQNRSITFRRSATLYIEIGRTTADVPN